MKEFTEEFIEQLKTKANKKACGDNPDFGAYDWSGGNYDDAYSMGVDDGEIYLAREILKKLGVL